MSGETDLKKLLSSMRPILKEEAFVFCTLPSGKYGDFSEANPLASFQEKEGLSLIIEQSEAERLNLDYEGSFKCISLEIHSSLEAVGLTAAISTALKNADISANVIAAFYHDHILVPSQRADEAMQILSRFSEE